MSQLFSVLSTYLALNIQLVIVFVKKKTNKQKTNKETKKKYDEK